MISVIIRTKNEERWIKPCLEGVMSQHVSIPIEIVLVDNDSTDQTVQKAKSICPELTLVTVSQFLPGNALNEGIRASRGEYIVCLSAHCPPVDCLWLSALLRNLDDPEVAGVYGRQIPTNFTSSVDKRDLMLTFGPERRVQKRDTFFHNANSMFRKDMWERFPFNESISNIEDRIWGKEVIQAGFKIVYEPDAMVFHHHGIHQDNRPDRAQNVVRILETAIDDFSPKQHADPFDPFNQEVVAIVPLRGGGDSIDFNRKLVRKTFESVRESRLIKRLIVATDSKQIKDMVQNMGAEVPFLRSEKLSGDFIRADDVVREYISRLEDEGYFPDIVVPLEVTYPFRPQSLIDGVILQLVKDGYDTVIAAMPEYRACWRSTGCGMEQLAGTNLPREERIPLFVGLPSLACATYPHIIRQGSRLGVNIGIHEVSDPLAGVEVREKSELERINSILDI